MGEFFNRENNLDLRYFITSEDLGSMIVPFLSHHYWKSFQWVEYPPFRLLPRT